MAGPRFAKYMRPLIDSLKELGNSGTPSEVRERVAQLLGLTDGQVEDQLKTGKTRFYNDLSWARYYLVKAGYLESSERGVWNLTQKGAQSNISPLEAQEIARSISREDRLKGVSAGASDEDEDSPPEDDGVPGTGDHRSDLLELLREMPPAVFERFCRRFLREAGFQQVEVTGRSGDGGIDGTGLLQINPLMSIQVLFQCKRYKGSVGSEAIRNFRGAMTGRTDKGIFLTTGTFTSEARREALRDGAPPIELVDADKLVEMCEKLELGLKPRTVFQVDTDFFKEFA